MYTVERYHDFCAGHRVYGHENKCCNLHGHNYRITFVCANELEGVRRQVQPLVPLLGLVSGLDEVGRVIDFSVMKERLCEWLEREWDHKMLLWSRDPLLDLIEQDVGDKFRACGVEDFSVVALPFNPTAENIAHFLVETVGPEQLKDTGVVLIECRVEETRKCTATYRKEGW